MTKVIHIAHKNLDLPIGDYVALIKKVKASEQGTRYKESLCGWWISTREKILQEFLYSINDRINKHLVIRDLSESRLNRKIEKKVISKCRWCGSSLGKYKNHSFRFCNLDCTRSYNGR